MTKQKIGAAIYNPVANISTFNFSNSMNNRKCLLHGLIVVQTVYQSTARYGVLLVNSIPHVSFRIFIPVIADKHQWQRETES